MAIKSLYRDYFQKSKIFLYPLLDIKRGGSATPIQTYVSWENNYKPEDRKLICLYHLRNDDEFLKFEKQKLLGNKYFDDFKLVENNKGIYVFDYKAIGNDWNCFLQGSYSKFSIENKKKIKSFFAQKNTYSYIESYLYPEKYFSMYADMLNIEKSLLISVGELCSKPDFEKETIVTSIKNLEISL